jgi:hypothetical protein
VTLIRRREPGRIRQEQQAVTKNFGWLEDHLSTMYHRKDLARDLRSPMAAADRRAPPTALAALLLVVAICSGGPCLELGFPSLGGLIHLAEQILFHHVAVWADGGRRWPLRQPVPVPGYEQAADCYTPVKQQRMACSSSKTHGVEWQIGSGQSNLLPADTKSFPSVRRPPTGGRPSIMDSIFGPRKQGATYTRSPASFLRSRRHLRG